MLAKVLAKSSGCFFLAITSSSILSKYLGDASRLVRAIFTLAHKLQPCIIFIDEVEALMGKRGSSGEHEATLQVKTEFMQHWEGLETSSGRVLVMGATNRPHMIDEAILRRFSQQYEIPLPNQRQREAILLGYLKKHNMETWSPVRSLGGVSESLLGYKEVLLPDNTQGKAVAWLASNTEGFSGSDLRELCSQAAQNVLADSIDHEEWREGEPITVRRAQNVPQVDLHDFVAALESVKPSSQKANDFDRKSSAAASAQHQHQHQVSPQDIQMLMELLRIFRSPGPSNGGS